MKKYDTAGNEIVTLPVYCPDNCGLTGGCNACRPGMSTLSDFKTLDCECEYEWVLKDGLCRKCEERFYKKFFKKIN